MTDKILLIENVEDIDLKTMCKTKSRWAGHDGVHIKTEQNEIWFLIDNSQNCCEQFGYLSSEDDYSDFIGAEYMGFDNIKVKDLNIPDDSDYEGGTAFLSVKTSQGVLQFAVYNWHNGYYGHEVYTIVNGEKVNHQFL